MKSRGAHVALALLFRFEVTFTLGCVSYDRRTRAKEIRDKLTVVSAPMRNIAAFKIPSVHARWQIDDVSRNIERTELDAIVRTASHLFHTSFANRARSSQTIGSM